MADNNFYQNIPKKRIASGALISSEKGQILLVKPTYKETWEVPGGITELNESPEACCKREIKEELGLDLAVHDLLCVDYVADSDDKGDSIQMIFDGGILLEPQIRTLILNTEELSECRFFDINNIDVEFNDKLRIRIQKAMEAKKAGKTIYLENPHR